MSIINGNKVEQDLAALPTEKEINKWNNNRGISISISSARSSWLYRFREIFR